jgi:hypothetical protein
MQKVRRILLRTCKKTTASTDKQMFNVLPLKEKVQLRASKAMRGTCNVCEIQSKLIDALLSKWFAIDSSKKPSKLNEDNKNKIIEEIQKI